MPSQKFKNCQIMRWIGIFRIKEQEEKCPLAKNQYNIMYVSAN